MDVGRHPEFTVHNDGRRASQSEQRQYGVDLPVHGGHVERLEQAPRNIDEQCCGRTITCVYGAVRSP